MIPEYLEKFLSPISMMSIETEEIKERVKKLFLVEEEIFDDLYPAVTTLILTLLKRCSPP